MFIKQKVFERLLNEAYKGSGVYVGCTKNDLDETVYCIATSNWALWVDTLELTKEVKGTLIKLCGDLPTYGHAFKAAKGCYNSDHPHDKYNTLLKKYFECKEELRKTRLFAWNYNSEVRIFQGSSGDICPIRCDFVDLVDVKAIDEETGETKPDGPLISPSGEEVFWRNDRCTLMVMTQNFTEEDKEFWNEVKKLKVI